VTECHGDGLLPVQIVIQIKFHARMSDSTFKQPQTSVTNFKTSAGIKKIFINTKNCWGLSLGFPIFTDRHKKKLYSFNGEFTEKARKSKTACGCDAGTESENAKRQRQMPG